MTTAVQHRRGTTAEHAVFTGLEGEVTIDTTKDTAVIHDGSLAGGYPLAKESLANVNPGALSAITGSATAADDVFLVYDTSATSMKKITRAELNNAIEADALASVTITGGTINGTSVGASTASSGAFTTLTTSGVTNLAGLTASTALALDASKNVVSVANTGTGSNVLNTSPTLVTPALGTPASGVMTNVTGTAAGLTAGNTTTNANLTGAVTSVGNAASLGSFTSAQLATALTDETGTGANVFATSPTLVTPALGTPSSGVVTNLTGTASININGTVGATTAAAGAFTTLSASGTSTLAAVNSGALAVTGAISSTTDATLSGVRVGKGAGAIASNTALGSGALNSNTTGINNTATGQSALFSNTTGFGNTASGRNALNANTTGYYNTASGYFALYSNTTGTQNTASGRDALANNTTGSSNTASGHTALANNTTGYNNTASGLQALANNTTGVNNTATGRDALLANTTGTQNTASGYQALANNTTGGSNTANGFNALLNNTTGSNNTASGQSALLANTTGSYNTASGTSALRNNTTGSNNTATSRDALYGNTTGSGNTALSPLNSAGSYTPVFNPTTENNRFCMGSTGVTNAYIQVAWTVVSDARDKINFVPVPHGLEFVKALQPTAYQFRTARDSEETNGGVRYGFKAQDVLELEGANPVIVDNEDADKLRMVDTALIPVLVKALQELNAKFDAYVLTHP